MTPEVCQSISDRYIELYEHVTGKKFVKAEDGDAAKRIEANVVACLNKLNK
jgi:phosphoribosylaminoimidazole-succinocarboxamide synthase